MAQPLFRQIQNLAPLTLIIVGLLSYNFMSAQWAGPTDAPPNKNADAPLHVGTTSQTKTGVLNASSLYGTYGVVANGISIGTCVLYGACLYDYETIQLSTGKNLRINFGTNERLQITNAGTLIVKGTSQVNANRYCDMSGGNCFSGSDVGAGASSGLGIGQTWRSFTGIRATNVWYQNTTSNPISVYVWVSPGDGFLYANTVGSDTGAVQIAGPDNDSGTRDNLFGIIPAGHWYKQTGRTPTGWSELR